jgi:predicted Zn-ribbon and HTH transcriptional regulator
VVWWVIVSIAVSATMSIARLGWYLARRGRTVVRQRRIDRCLCPSCGYDTKQSVLIGRCPECGSEIYERPEVY